MIPTRCPCCGQAVKPGPRGRAAADAGQDDPMLFDLGVRETCAPPTLFGSIERQGMTRLEVIDDDGRTAVYATSSGRYVGAVNGLTVLGTHATPEDARDWALASAASAKRTIPTSTGDTLIARIRKWNRLGLMATRSDQPEQTEGGAA